MPDTLLDIVAEFVGKPPRLVRGIVIHLRRAVERGPLLESLMEATGPLEVWDAADGTALIAAGHPTACGMDPGLTRTAGEVGCMVSHVSAARKALEDGVSHLVVFEDDCVPADGFSLEAVRGYLGRVRRFSEEFGMEKMDELLLLGTCGCYEWRNLCRGVKATDHFNGSHAYIMGRPMMQKLVNSYEYFVAKGRTVPVDGILPLLLQAEHRHAFCPEDDVALFRQNRDIPSYVVSDGDALRQG